MPKFKVEVSPDGETYEPLKEAPTLKTEDEAIRAGIEKVKSQRNGFEYFKVWECIGHFKYEPQVIRLPIVSESDSPIGDDGPEVRIGEDRELKIK
jgi:hypothetical protein